MYTYIIYNVLVSAEIIVIIKLNPIMLIRLVSVLWDVWQKRKNIIIDGYVSYFVFLYFGSCSIWCALPAAGVDGESAVVASTIAVLYVAQRE